GLTQAKPGAAPRWDASIWVDDIAKSYQVALAAGAKGATPPTAIGTMGQAASIVDPTGAAISLWQGDGREDREQTPVGDWAWNELWTPDASKALVFYEKAFGYTHEAMSMGDQGTYLMLVASGRPRGGIFQAPDSSTPPMWMPYVQVADCDATADKATALGAKVFMPPTQVAGVGRFAAMFDPQGAAIAFIKSDPQPV
ncbi:MAG TPA: VOC family protein, partial [Albitalea sp.]|nr:VOC family protein [Albitalea sp.]